MTEARMGRHETKRQMDKDPRQNCGRKAPLGISRTVYSIRLPKIASPAWIKIYIASCLAPSNKFYYRATKSNFGKTFIFHLCLQPRNSKQSKSGKILEILFEALNN